VTFVRAYRLGYRGDKAAMDEFLSWLASVPVNVCLTDSPGFRGWDAGLDRRIRECAHKVGL